MARLRFLILVLAGAGAFSSSSAQRPGMPPELQRHLERLRAEHKISVAEWRPVSNAVVPRTDLRRARFPVVDVHTHLRNTQDDAGVRKTLETMDAANVRTVVHLTGGYGERLRETVEQLSGAYPDRFVVCATIDWRTINNPDFSAQTVRSLEEAHRMGARCLKITKILGLGVKDTSGKYVPVNAPRLDPVWAKCGDLGMPVMIHVADPIAFFRPWDETNETYSVLSRWPDWYFHGNDYTGTPRFTHEELMRQRNDIVERHRQTTFVALHYASLSHDLAAVGELLDRYSNMWVEMGARNWALGSVPNSGRKFAIKYQDRILFGTDGAVQAEQYQQYFRTLETDDDMIHFPLPSPWGPIHGVSLPDEALRKIYHENARKLFPFLK